MKIMYKAWKPQDEAREVLRKVGDNWNAVHASVENLSARDGN